MGIETVIDRARGAALELRGELWPRVIEAARDPRVAAARITGEPSSRGAAGPRSVGSRALAIKLDLHTGSRAYARRLAAAAGYPDPTLGASDSQTPAALSRLTELLEPAAATPAGTELVLEVAGWLGLALRAARAVTGTGNRPQPAGTPAAVGPPAPASVGPCPVCARSLYLEPAWQSVREPRLQCTACGHTEPLAARVPASLPAALTGDALSVTEAAARYGVPPRTARWWASHLEPVGARGRVRLYARDELAAFARTGGRVATVHHATPVAA